MGRGIPNLLNTKADVLNCIAMANSGEISKTELATKLQALLSDEKVWNFKAAVSASYTPAANEQVLEQVVEGVTEYLCFEKVANPAARFLRMGLTKAEIEAHIAALSA